MAVRIYSLAKELKFDSKELVDICTKAGVPGKGSALASLTEEEVEKVKAFLKGGGTAKAKPTAKSGQLRRNGRANRCVPARCRSSLRRSQQLQRCVRNPPSRKSNRRASRSWSPSKSRSLSRRSRPHLRRRNPPAFPKHHVVLARWQVRWDGKVHWPGSGLRQDSGRRRREPKWRAEKDRTGRTDAACY